MVRTVLTSPSTCCMLCYHRKFKEQKLFERYLLWKNPHYAKNPYFPSKKGKSCLYAFSLRYGTQLLPFCQRPHNLKTTGFRRVGESARWFLVGAVAQRKMILQACVPTHFLPEERDVECWTLRIHLADTIESSLASGSCSGQITLLTSADISLTAEFFFAFPNFVALTKHNCSADTLTLALVRWLPST